MSRTKRDGSSLWIGFGFLLVAALAAGLYLSSTLSEPRWSPEPTVQPAATALEQSALDSERSAAGAMADRGSWSIQSASGGLRLVYRR